jgi:hypothetical protein
MKKFFITTAMVFCFSILHAQYSFQNLNSQLVNKTVTAIAADNDGNTIVAGGFNTSITFGNTTLTNNTPYPYGCGAPAGFIAKLTPNENFSWAKKIGIAAGGNTTANDGRVEIRKMVTDAAGNIYFTGRFLGTITFDNIKLTSKKNGAFFAFDMFTAKMSANGAFLWAKAEGSNYDAQGCSAESGLSVAVDNQGNVYATGKLAASVFKNSSCGPHCPDALVYSVYVVKYNSSGTKVWEKKYVNSQVTKTTACIIPSGTDLVTDGANIYVTGGIAGSVSFGNNITLSTGNNLKKLPFLLKLDGNGTAQWAQMATSNSSTTGDRLLMDNNNQNIYWTGNSGTVTFGCATLTGGGGGFLAKYTSSGNCQWAVNVNGRGGRPFSHANGNIALMCGFFMDELKMIEYSPASGAEVNVTAPANANANMSDCANLGDYLNVASTSSGFVFSQNLQGSYDFGGTTISSTQPVGSNYWDLILVKYTEPSPPVVRPGAITSELSAAGIVLYPNPASHQLTIRNNENKMLGTIMIYDAAGKLVYKNLVGNSQTRINIEKFLPGVYYLRTGQSTSAIKFIKQ